MILLSFIGVWGIPNAHANERKFTYVYETSVLPPGAREIELWNTYRSDKGYFYRRLDQRVEYEFGVINNLMGSIYLNSSWYAQDSTGVKMNGADMTGQAISISSEWKYKLMDRVADLFGLALYGEATLGLHEDELEGKILFDKQFRSILLAFNGVVEQEWETEMDNGIAQTEEELSLEFDLGASYQATPSFSFGFEMRNHNVIKDGDIEHSAFFAGPVVSYAAENWWATFTVLPQIASLKGSTTGNLDLHEYEKVEARLLFSFHL
ncbi:MAG: hypothetical protein EHM64_16915 [Ignavibacteriae bacterium]|nr:MAG: hypothetical protein EHM64_16915 [Ignavibacteriota bacterium]